MKTTLTILFTGCLLTVSSFQLHAQSTLAVNCYDSDTPFNSVSINDEIVEYGTVSSTPGFYVVVIDQTTCSSWGTNYNGANPTHSFGNYNETNGRPRVENYFYFQYNDSLQLAGMTNMLQQIPAGHAIVIYTPISYDYNLINTTNANLIQALASRWDPTVIEGNDIMILFGIQNDPLSYVDETTLTGGQLSYSTTICNSLSLNEEAANEELFIGKLDHTFTLNPSLNATALEVLDATGRTIPVLFNENELLFPSNTANGIYVIRVNSKGKWLQTKQAISF